MVAGKIVVCGVTRLPLKTKYPTNNNFDEASVCNLDT